MTQPTLLEAAVLLLESWDVAERLTFHQWAQRNWPEMEALRRAVTQATPPPANRTPEQLEHADRLIWQGIQNARRNEAKVKAIKERRYR